MFNTSKIENKVFRVYYTKEYTGGTPKTYVKFFFLYADMEKWITNWQSDTLQVFNIEEYIIKKTGDE